jgi:hypothetical protein
MGAFSEIGGGRGRVARGRYRHHRWGEGDARGGCRGQGGDVGLCPWCWGRAWLVGRDAGLGRVLQHNSVISVVELAEIASQTEAFFVIVSTARSLG